jgi:hypothetical protein
MTLRRRLEDLERVQRLLLRQLAISRELDHARYHLQERARLLGQWEAALDCLAQAHQRGDPERIRSCRQRLDQARQAYRELVAGHAHAPIAP